MSQRTQAATQEQRILNLLHASWPNWTPALELSNISLQYNARIFALRRKGWQIANKLETRNGVKRGAFRLASPGTRPNPPARKASNPSGTTFPEFGAISPDRSYAE